MSGIESDSSRHEILQTTIYLNESDKTALLASVEQEKTDRLWIAKFKAATGVMRDLIETKNNWAGDVSEHLSSAEKLIEEADSKWVIPGNEDVIDVREYAYNCDPSFVRNAFPAVDTKLFDFWFPDITAMNLRTGKVLIVCTVSEGELGDSDKEAWFMIDPTLAEQPVSAEIMPGYVDSANFRRLSLQLI